MRAERALRVADARGIRHLERQVAKAGGSRIDDRLVGDFGSTASVSLDDVGRWVCILCRHCLLVQRALPAQSGDVSRLAVMFDHSGATFDGLGREWNAARHALQSGVRVLALVRHYLPIWRANRHDMWARFGEFRGTGYAIVAAKRILTRWPSPPFGLFGLSDLSDGARVLPARLGARLDALEATLDRAGRVFQVAGLALDSLRRRKEPSTSLALLAEAAALARSGPSAAR